MNVIDTIKVGMTLTLQKKITVDDTALNYGSGKIPNLFATPRLVAFLIEASSQLIDPKLPEGFVSVGHHVEVDHFNPTVVGSTVTIEIKVLNVDHGKYTLGMKAYDDFGQIGSGTHTRTVVNYEKMMEKAQSREIEIQEEV